MRLVHDPTFIAPQLVGSSDRAEKLRADIAVAARSHAKVLILGETGAGKEVAARQIHANGPRRDRPFVALNCAGLSETLVESELFGHVRGSFTGAYRDSPGLIRQADRGTLFLDELGEMSLRTQAMLLRFTETGEIQQVGNDSPGRPVDVRLITATNRDLREQVRKGAFREDLYYRLNVLQIVVPSLRERDDDILDLLEYWLDHAARAHGLPKPSVTPAAAAVLRAYPWPGNVRELRNAAERLVLLQPSRPLTAADVPVEFRTASSTDTRPIAAHHRSVGGDALWERMAAGEDFWTVVAQPLKRHQITRNDLTALIHRGLTETGGRYSLLLQVFNLPRTDYKRFHAFLYQHQCNLPVGSYRAMAKSPVPVSTQPIPLRAVS